MQEFAENAYKNVSISRLVDRAGIAKGSFYQYFEDKADLYLYLIELAMQEKMKFLENTPPPSPDMGIFAYLRWIGREGVRFELSSPHLAKISYRALYDDVPLPDETMQVIRGGALTFFEDMVAKGIASGDLDPNIDPQSAAFVINSVILNLGTYMIERLDIKIEEVFAQTRSPLDTPEGERIYDAVIAILESGIGKNIT